jgi:hypothetical protein|tara:strand:- start:3099 stop:3734 length:636 start_codon:yes stop_codon:yes gene_type:complete
MRRKMNSIEAGARADSMLYVSIILISSFILIAILTNPVYSGIAVDDRAIEIEGKIYDGGTWVDFTLSEQVTNDWEIDNDVTGTWYMVEFMDINCGHCKNAASDITSLSNDWMNNRDITNGDSVEFLAVSINLGMKGDDYTPANIVNFRNNYEHQFAYLDDLDNSVRDDWDIPGTPTYFLINPLGVIAYASPDAVAGETVWDAMDRIIPTGE